MGRLFQILLYVIVLIVLFSVISIGCKKCKATSEEMLENAKDGVDNVADSPESALSDTNDEFFGDGDDNDYGNSRSENQELADELFQEADITYEDDAEEAPVKADKPRKTVQPRYSSSAGRYMIIAGNYLVEENARNMVRRLSNNGYSSAESVVFDDSRYYTVLASRTDDYNQALSTSSRLKSEGIDNYVKTQKD